MNKKTESNQIDLSQNHGSGLEILDADLRNPSHGLLDTFPLSLPDFEHICYFSTDDSEIWPGDANRILPWIAENKLASLFNKKDNNKAHASREPSRCGIFTLLHLKSGDFLALIPMAGSQTMAWLYAEDSGDIELHVGSLGTAPVQEKIPLIAWARADNIYDACRTAWEEVINYTAPRMGTRWRRKKTYNKPFHYLGWCSWEQYKKDISCNILEDAADTLENSDLPVRWMLVDDGHQTEENQKLKSLEPDDRKFPEGWQKLLSRRKENGLKWFGLWHCYFGLWKGIHPENDLGVLNDDLVRKGQALFPGKNKKSAQNFYDALIGSARDSGFDFVKIDVQASYLREMQGMPKPVQMNVHTAQALERACERNMDGLINCMAHNSVCIFNTRSSAVTRCSIDYELNDEVSAKSHLHQSYTNTLWLGQTVWPDHDMFHSSDTYCGRMMAISKAMSGAPVYLSDAPTEFKKEYIKPLIYEDGELLRPLAPAVPLPESVFADALNKPRPYRVIAPLANQCAAIVIYNLMHPTPDQAIQAEISPDDYAQASSMLQPYNGKWDSPKEGLVIYDWYAGHGAKLDSPYTTRLKGFNDRLFILSPIVDGWSVLGRSDKYLGPGAVETIDYGQDKCSVQMVESGPLIIWNEDGVPFSRQSEHIEKLGDGLWKLSFPTGIRQYTVEINLG